MPYHTFSQCLCQDLIYSLLILLPMTPFLILLIWRKEPFKELFKEKGSKREYEQR
jgi:hypothetical protein